LRFLGLCLLCVTLGVASCSALYHSVDRRPSPIGVMP